MSDKTQPKSDETQPKRVERSWKKDLLSGFLVFLIALPLSLGIAMASGFPPIAGVLTAIVGGMVVSFLGSAPLTIKGPAAGLIVITFGAVSELGGGDPILGYRRALAVGVAAAVLQVIMALLKAGKLGDMFPSSVVHGMLAAIGVIIVAKQIHLVMGVSPEAGEAFELLAEVPHSLARYEPEIFAIGLLSLIILIGTPLIPWKHAKKIPAPLLVLLTAVPLALIFDLGHRHHYLFLGEDHVVGPEFLVHLPGNILNAIVFPDFSQLATMASVKYIVMYSLVGTVESLLSVKAVDALDPNHYESDLNKDLLATGIGNLLVSLIGGLPMISEIVRSSANISAGAQSRLSNFFHGAFLLFFVAALPFVLQQIPLAALAAMLVYTGLRLGSPTEFVKTYRIGSEQLLIFVTTFVVTLATDLLIGVGTGIVLKVLIHLRNGAPLRSLFSADIEEEIEGDTMILRVKGAAIFTNYLGLRARLDRARDKDQKVIIDFSNARLIDHTVREKIEHLVGEGRPITLEGLSEHTKLSEHDLSAMKKASR
ncbi:MAG TPA: SulP family inorganic anion transporter [Polyangiaceae bacterium]|nr:SulP family inorganic anion transporter [Polyangiaceae bacterium]